MSSSCEREKGGVRLRERERKKGVLSVRERRGCEPERAREKEGRSEFFLREKRGVRLRERERKKGSF